MDFVVLRNAHAAAALYVVVALYRDRHYFIVRLRAGANLNLDHETLRNAVLVVTSSQVEAEREGARLGGDFRKVRYRKEHL